MKEQLDRIEAKIDQGNTMLVALLDALAEDCEVERPQFDLDGNPIESGKREENESLD